MRSPEQTPTGITASLRASLYLVRGPLYVVLGAIGVVLLAGLVGLRGTVTGSLPRGLYLARPFHAPARPGDTVSLCLPDPLARWMHARRYLAAGPFCRNGVQRLTKVILAREGDTVTLTRRGMIHRGRLLSNTAPLERDGRGRAMPQLAPGHYVLPPGHLWLYSTYSPRTIDSRYFGPLPESRVHERWRPLWTEGKAAPPTLRRARRATRTCEASSASLKAGKSRCPPRAAFMVVSGGFRRAKSPGILGIRWNLAG